MPFWLIALLILSSTVAFNFLTAGRLKRETRKPAGLGEFNFPTATEVRTIPVIVGRVLQKAPNCIWYGDLQTIPIKKKVPNPAFFGLIKKTIETGQYRYFVGMQLGLAHGPGVHLREVLVDDKTIWSGDITSGSFTVEKSNLFGGEEKEGGIAAIYDYYSGSFSQTYSTYLQTQFDADNKISSNRGISYLMQRGPSAGTIAPRILSGYIGISPNLKPFSFILERFPDNLGVSSYHIVNTDDANPIEWAYEILTNPDWGKGESPDNIDLPSFQSAAQQCFDDGIGLSIIEDVARGADDVLNDIIELVDGACFRDRFIGKWVFKLARADYDIDDLPIFDNSNIIEHKDFGVNVIDDAPNVFIAKYIDKAAGFKERPTDFKNLADQRIQGERIPEDISLYGCANAEQANKACFREARIYASNLRKATIIVNRDAFQLKPLSVFIYRRHNVNSTENYTDTVMRVAKIDDGNYYDGEIEIEAIQDVFANGEIMYAPPPPSEWTAIDGQPVAIDAHFTQEQPYFISGDSLRIWDFANQPNGAQRNYDILVKLNSESDFSLLDSNADFCPSGLLSANYARGDSVYDTAIGFSINSVKNGVLLNSATNSEIAYNGSNLFMFEDSKEICAFETIVNNGDGTYMLSKIWRGLFDTTIENHLSGTRIWFFSEGAATPDRNFTNGLNINIKRASNSLSGIYDPLSDTPTNILLDYRSGRPLPPTNVKINNVFNPTVIPINSSDIVITWLTRNRLIDTVVKKQSDANSETEVIQRIGIKIYRGSDDTLVATYENLVGNTWTYTPAMQVADNTDIEDKLQFVIYSIRGIITSYQAIKYNTARPTFSPVSTYPAYAPSGTYIPPVPGQTTNINGVPITGIPDSTNTVPVYDPVTGTIIWVPPGSGGLTIREIDGTPSGIGTILEFPNGQVVDMGSGVFRVTPLQGAMGATGATGSTGPVGAAGADGINGSTWFYGPGVPSGGLGVNGDYYLRTGDGDVYNKNSGSWSVIANIKGADGAASSIIRQELILSVASVGAGSSVTGTVAFGKSFSIKDAVFAHSYRFQLYKTASQRTADAGRSFGDKSYEGTEHGLICDILLNSSTGLDWIFSNDAFGSNNDFPVTANTYYRLTNLTMATVNAEIIFHYTVLET